MDLKAIGLKIKALRKEGGLSQDQLAAMSGVSRNSINDLEQGRGNPTLSTFETLASAFGVNITVFFDRFPAEFLGAKGAEKGVEQKHTSAKKSAEAEDFAQSGGRNPVKFSSDIPLVSLKDLASGLAFVSEFAGQSRDIQLTVMSLVYGRTEYLKLLSPEFREQLSQLLLIDRK